MSSDKGSVRAVREVTQFGGRKVVVTRLETAPPEQKRTGK
jgi:hypothetical protein